ncbi:MAG TPA: IS200/IS605 family transposase [Bacteroidia bacterium]|nr:IS200/IS605 family transposase [Bacteroidia bacterium]
MSYVTIWIHCVWSTKNRKPLLVEELRQKLFLHILDNGRKKGIWIDTINDHQEHVHALISLDKNMTIANSMQLIKGESANWLNKTGYLNEKMNWQDDYFAVSLGQSQVERVRNYIINQEEHHRKKSFTEEVDEFMNKYGWNKFKDVVSG